MKKIFFLFVLSHFITFSQTLNNTEWLVNPASCTTCVRYFTFNPPTASFKNNAIDNYTVYANYFENGDTSTFLDKPGYGDLCSENFTGKYTFKISNDSLKFTVVNEPCSARVFLASYTWIRYYTGISESQLKSKNIKVFPNPALDNLFLESNNKEFAGSEIEITNYLGQIVLKSPYIKEIDVSKLNSGIYTLKINTKDNQSYYSIFVKE